MPRSPRGKKKSATRGQSRFEIAQTLGVGLTTVDRLIAFGLRPVGYRGRAKLYAVAAARRLAQKLAPAQAAASEVLIQDYASHAADLHDRRQHEVREWIADAAWRPLWQAAVAAVSRLSASWPHQLAERLGSVPEAERAHLGRADGPRPDPPAPLQYLRPDQVQALLAGDPAAQPWPPAARPGLATLAARGVGIAIADDGGWMDWDPATGIPQPIVYPPPVMRPLLAGLADFITRSPAFAGLDAALRVPALEPLPPTPQDVPEARTQWRQARAAYRQVRTAVRRDHRRRPEVIARTIEAIAQFRARWWRARAELARLAGDPEAVRAQAEAIRQEALSRLLSLEGWPEESMAATSSERTRKEL